MALGATTARLIDVAIVFAGGTPSRRNKMFYGGGIPWVKSGEVSGPPIVITEETLSEDGLANSSAKWCEAGASLVAMYGATAGVVGRLAIRATTNQAVLCVQARDKSDEDFLYYALRAAAPWLLRRTQGSGQPNLNAGMVKSLSIAWPDSETRSRTVEMCHLLEAITEAIRGLITAKRELKRALMQDVLTGRRRLPQFDRLAWVEAPLSHIAKSVTHRNYGGRVTRVLTCSGEQGLIDQREYFSKSVASESLENYVLLRRGDFAYNRSAMKGYPYGATKRLDRYDEGVLSTLNVCFRLNGNRWVSDFATHVFESGLLNTQLRRITRVGSRAHGLLNVTKSEFFSLRVPMPSIEEQTQIASLLTSLDRDIAMFEHLLKAYTLLERGLMPRLLANQLPFRPAVHSELIHA